MKTVQPPAGADIYIDLNIIKTTRSRDTEKVSAHYLVQEGQLQIVSTQWGVQRGSYVQKMPLSERHLEDLAAYLRLSWENLRGQIHRLPVKGDMGRTYTELELQAMLDGQTTSLSIRAMQDEVVKNIHFLSGRLLSEYLDKYFLQPGRFPALEWAQQGL